MQLLIGDELRNFLSWSSPDQQLENDGADAVDVAQF